ncbi:aldehyde dehydrogenase family protein [Brevundimonas sp. A19_0]|uniref:L-piperidine-6-carboxylate dehydrogenase n=1 Tax=Brevundimonas sp. A19_0 TaxID=2821087 RepID=UPI001ADC483D|nr:aldehyde dehydrogenase family protein [Brevundimonas sp. A19_0]MBO9502761.1 aldehyde dehydrogenase family protein [Brevundimonas sp. A19_0]
MTTAAHDLGDTLKRLGVSPAWQDGGMATRSPVDGTSAGRLAGAAAGEVEAAVGRACAAFDAWRRVPAPRRGELVRLLGEELRVAKDDLARLVTLEAGKITSEGLGEVQEMIDVCDFAVGLSRQLYGLTLPSERPGHHMRETWQPLGPVAVITAFNFPVAVWAWNAALALVCGDPVIWKPSDKTSLVALAVQAVFERAVARFGADAPEGLNQVLVGGAEVGQALARDPRIPLVSATGSTRMGKAVAVDVAGRLGRSLLELGGNNAMIVAPGADLDLAVRAIAFSAVGTCGQRCTSLRRLLVHEDLADGLIARLKVAYETLPVGDPRDDGTLIGPLIDEASAEAMAAALTQAVAEGGEVVTGGQRLDRDGAYVRPAIVRMPEQSAIVRHETFAPILYVMTWRELDQAIAMQNAVPQGLSSCIFTDSVRQAETFLSAWGSDCGIANVNIGPSGAEIGGAFGGEKDTGGGRESGSDAWKAYMRRQTQTVNFSTALPLAQGVRFDV